MTTPPAPALLTLLTDFGTRDYYVAAVKGAVLSRAPATTVVDITHDIAPGDVEEAAFVLSAAAPAFPPHTLHLAVVDPGVGSSRAMLALATPAGRFLAPDNGLLTRQLETLAQGTRPIAVERPDLYAVAPSATFHGRDRFAPVAAAWLLGEALERLGKPLADPARLAVPPPRRAGGTVTGRVAHVDRFGNLVTDVPADWIAGGSTGMARAVRVALGAHTATAHATHFAALPPGQPGWIIGSLGTLELVLRDASLAAQWQASRGDIVRVELL